MAVPTLVLQTTYAELLDRCARAAFASAFAPAGAFTSKTIKGKRYWYFQSTVAGHRTQRYVGPETPELLDQIARHNEIRDDELERRGLVSTLVRSFGMPQPAAEIGDTLSVLARAGVFRLRGVLVGTLAYQTYSAMLGSKLPIATLQTGYIDIAQFKNVSVAVADQMAPVLDVLRKTDKTFSPVPTIHGGHVTSYAAKGGLRVDFLTPNQGREIDEPQHLPAFQTDAQALRFLDFLIADPVPAVILHGAGIYVNVPTPQRYAVHKLIIARRRIEGTAKRDKDVYQADALIALLLKKRRHDLKEAWQEAVARGSGWRRLLNESLDDLNKDAREEIAALVP